MMSLKEATKQIGAAPDETTRTTLIEEADAEALRDLLHHRKNPQLIKVTEAQWGIAQFRLSLLDREETNRLIWITIKIAAWSIAATVIVGVGPPLWRLLSSLCGP